MAALAPKDRPSFADPSAPVAPLEALHPIVEARRDPQAPFDVASSTMTSDSAWGALHWNPPSGSSSGSWGAPSHRALAGPGAADGPDQPARLRSRWHADPGHPGLVRTRPLRAERRTPREQGARAVFAAATPGLCICLLIGGLIYVIAPVMLLVSFGLSRRVWVSGRRVRTAFGVGLGIFGLLAILGSMTSEARIRRVVALPRDLRAVDLLGTARGHPGDRPSWSGHQRRRSPATRPHPVGIVGPCAQPAPAPCRRPCGS